MALAEICFSPHNSMFFTHVAPFKRKINQLYSQETLLQQRNNPPNTNFFFTFCAMYVQPLSKLRILMKDTNYLSLDQGSPPVSSKPTVSCLLVFLQCCAAVLPGVTPYLTNKNQQIRSISRAEKTGAVFTKAFVLGGYLII